MKNALGLLAGLVVGTTLLLGVGCGSDDDDDDGAGQAGAPSGGAGGAGPSASGGAAGSADGLTAADLCPEIVAAQCPAISTYVPTVAACEGGLPTIAGFCASETDTALACTGPDPDVTCDSATGMPAFAGCETEGAALWACVSLAMGGGSGGAGGSGDAG